MNPTPLRRLLTGAAAAVLGLSLLTSCAGQPDLDGGAAAQLQTRVASAKQLAAQQDFPAALAELDRLGQEVAAAAGDGRMSQERKSRIEAAIGAIRSELEAALPQAPPATPAPTPMETEPQEPEDQKKGGDDAGKDAEKQREEAEKKAEKQRENR